MCVDLIPLGDFSFFEHLYSIVVREYGTTGFWFSRMYLYLFICIKTINAKNIKYHMVWNTKYEEASIVILFFTNNEILNHKELCTIKGLISNL